MGLPERKSLHWTDVAGPPTLKPVPLSAVLSILARARAAIDLISVLRAFPAKCRRPSTNAVSGMSACFPIPLHAGCGMLRLACRGNSFGANRRPHRGGGGKTDMT